jgi:hypothetical protein
VLWQQGAPSDARDAVEQAIGLGGPHLAIYLDTRNTMLHNPLPAPRVTAP